MIKRTIQNTTGDIQLGFRLCMLIFAISISACGGSPNNSELLSKKDLGELLYNDSNLSFNRTQSCATCHNTSRAMIDDRIASDNKISAVSLGDDGISLGDRNAPTAAYASFSPVFKAMTTRKRHNPHNSNNTYTGALGGQFRDGREPDLQGQAGSPPTNPIEMGMPDKAAVVARIMENEKYINAFQQLYGDGIFDNATSVSPSAYVSMTDSISEFEKSDQFASFDSKYDRSLIGEYVMSFKELTGKALFFSQFSNCNICHQLHAQGDPINKFQETFSGYEYHNIGIPENITARALNGVTEKDKGLLLNPLITDVAESGKFKVPTLRNVAVTEPYMHNGVFKELKTTVLFYDKFVNNSRVNNPETGAPWADPEIPDTVATDLMLVSRTMSDFQVDSMVCFLRTLTDKRFESLIEDKDIFCDD